MNRIWMHERNLEAEHPPPRRDVDQLRAGARKIRERSVDVLDLVRDVMHPRAALRQEPPDRGVLAERGEKLHAAVADAHRGRFDALVVHPFAVLERAAEEPLVRRDRLVEVGHGDADVVDSPCLHQGDGSLARPWRDGS